MVTCICLHAADRGKKRAHHPGFLRLVVGLAMHLGFRAAGRLHGGARGAALGFRAGDHGAAGTRAGWAFADLTGLVAGADAGWACGNRRLQDVAAHIGRRGAFCLEHVATHIGLRGAGRN